MKGFFKRLLCALLGCRFKSTFGYRTETRKMLVKKGRNRRWEHARFEHRTQCKRCGRWSRWIRRKHFDSWLERQQQ
ncbi:hypothetical protein [uncultured Endozoicomonas sp.]|uniref:hypothetical protein n=1 Tax=uncultured Endozoicomonas sp. TaxID=432652 RepID=UPI0026144A4D|nr:hypothetical protein [uncultured Endozoicomonas sp.]